MCTSDTDLVLVKKGEKRKENQDGNCCRGGERKRKREKIKMVIAAEEDVVDSCARKVLRLNLFFLLSRTFGRGVKNANSTLCMRR